MFTLYFSSVDGCELLSFSSRIERYTALKLNLLVENLSIGQNTIAGNGISLIGIDLLSTLRITGSFCHFNHTLWSKCMQRIIDETMATVHKSLRFGFDYNKRWLSQRKLRNGVNSFRRTFLELSILAQISVHRIKIQGLFTVFAIYGEIYLSNHGRFLSIM